MGFSKQEYWSGLPCLAPGNLPHPGIQSTSSASQPDCLSTGPPGKPRKTKMPKLTPYFSGLFPARGFQLYIPKWTQFSFSNLISISLMLSALFFFFSLSSPTLQIHCSLTFLFFQSCFSWNSLWLWWPHVLSCNPTFTVLPHSTDLEQCKGPHPMLFQAGRWGTEDCHYPTHSPTTIFLSGAEYNKL